MYFLNGEQLIFYSSKAKQEDGKWITGEAASTIWDDLDCPIIFITKDRYNFKTGKSLRH